MLMNYGLVLDVLNGARGVPPNIADFIEKRRMSDFKKTNLRIERLMIKWLSAMNLDHDRRVEDRPDAGPQP